ncbi:MAG: hypothetical protein EXS31_08300 [Pedosphaera sp.]|nr:hypothetical protein [Pedosphaera sp.]
MISGKYDSMTVNERLEDAGMLQAFDKAAFGGDGKELERILTLVDLPKDGIRTIVEWVHGSPQSPYRRKN